MENGPTLFDLLQENPVDWSSLIYHPRLSDGLRTGLFGTTILSKDPPIDVVRSLIEAHRSEIFREETYRVALHTPLHCACERGSDPEIIEMIIAADPAQAVLAGGVRWKVHPFHIVRDEPSARLIAAACPGAISAPDCYGRLPLHHAAGRAESSPELVRFLIEEGRARGLGGDDFSGGSFVEDEDGVTPIRCVLERVQALLEESDERQRLHLCEGGPEWHKMAVLARACSDCLKAKRRARQGIKGCNESSCSISAGFSLVHTLLEVGSPAIVLSYAIKAYSSQLREKDEWGRLPLAIAASQHKCSKEIIELLLDSDIGYPPAAKVSDVAGRLPLHIASENGRKYDDGLRCLFEAAPKSLECCDAVTSLFPFMLASTGLEANVDTIYRLLRESPSVLQIFCSKSRKRKKEIFQLDIPVKSKR
mmetsp:Transcript_38640/g.116017  ORF Transcript_38640/g.116017 Transcript_38640/m.116017 type:complete len:421 (-) Transcript_38640:6581-7843(-)